MRSAHMHGDNAIKGAEIRRPLSGTIEDQQLVLDEHGFGHHGTRAAGTDEPGDCRQQMQKKHGEIAHRTILARSRHARNPHDFWNSPCTGRISVLEALNGNAVHSNARQ
jgi:hypothetical protein